MGDILHILNTYIVVEALSVINLAFAYFDKQN